MATKTNINEIDSNILKKILEACEKSFPKELNLEEFYGSDQTTWSIPEIGISYENTTSKEKLLRYVETLTDTNNIRLAYATIFEEIEKRKTEKAPRPEDQEKTTINKEESEELISKAEKREGEIKETREKAEKYVKESEERQKVIQEQQEILRKKALELEKIDAELKDKKVYVKVEEKESPKFTEDEKKAFDNYKEEAKARPQETIDDLSKVIEDRVSPILSNQGLNNEEINLASKQTAARIVENIVKIDDPSYISPMAQFAVLDKVSKDEKIVPKIFKKAEILGSIRNLTSDTTKTVVIPDIVSKNVTALAFGESFASNVFGVDQYQFEVTFSEIPEEGFSNSVSFYDLNQNYKQALNDQDSALEEIKGIGISKSKSFFYKKAGNLLNERILKIAPNSAAGKLLQSSEVKSFLYSRFGIGSAVNWEASNKIGNLLLKISPESAPIISSISKLTGINFGIAPASVIIETAPILGTVVSGATPAVGVLATKTAIQTGAQATGQVASKVAAPVATKVASGLFPKIFAALGTAGGWVTFGLSTAIGFLLGKIIEKINWKKVKEVFLPILAIGGGILIGGPVGLTLMGAGGLVAIGAVKTGAGIAGFFASIGVLMGGIFVAITTPIIIILLVIPPLIAFIMFVINSGAYIVPPAPVTDIVRVGNGTGVPIVCSDAKEPISFSNISGYPIAERSWEIVADLYQGFWCYWNRSPGDAPTDVVDYLPSYPELFDYNLFLTNPNPTREQAQNCGGCLFWCTWLIQKAYTESGNNILFTLWAPTMQDDFTKRGKFIASNQSTPNNIMPGSVIFFDVQNSLSRTDHVGIAHTVNSDGILFIQSNAGTKDSFIPFNSNGIGLQNIPGINIVGIGTP